jgi:hypothetical protein
MKKLTFLLILVVTALAFPKGIVWATQSNLRCSPSTGTYNVGDTFTVQYQLDTRGFPIWGLNAVANYDATVLLATASQSDLTPPTGWGTPTTNTIDTSTGKITIDWGNTQPSFTGASTFGSVVMRAQAPGQAQFNYVFFQQYDNTTPGVSKVWGKYDGVNLSNILTDVNNCIFVVTGTITSTHAPTIPGATATPSPTLLPGQPTYTPAPTLAVTELPKAGSVGATISLLGLAGVFLFAGGLLPALIYLTDKS